MATQADSPTPPFSVMGNLAERLAALTEEQLASPPGDAEEPDDTFTIFGSANDGIRRLLVASSVVGDEYNALVPELNALSRRAGPPSGILARLPEVVRELFGDPLSAEEKLRFEELKAQADLRSKLFELLQRMLWLEVGEVFPASRGNGVQILSDWSVAASKNDEESHFHIVTIGVGGFGLDEMFGGRDRRH